MRPAAPSAAATLLGLLAWVPAAAAQLDGSTDLAPATPGGAVAGSASGDASGGVPAGVNPVPDSAGTRAKRKEATAAAWWLFLATAGGLIVLVLGVWLVGWAVRRGAAEGELQTELFDARAKAEIERHRREMQQEKEAAARAADGIRDAPDDDGLGRPTGTPEAGVPDAEPPEPAAPAGVRDPADDQHP